MTELHPFFDAGRGLDWLIGQARPAIRESAVTHTGHLSSAMRAGWQWSVTDDESLVFACALVEEAPGRAWAIGLPGEALKDARQLLRLRRPWSVAVASPTFHTIRALVREDDDSARAFAHFLAFDYDCGPMTEFALDGSDMGLWIRRNGGGLSRTRRQ
jgi:hypothetical protein